MLSPNKPIGNHELIVDWYEITFLEYAREWNRIILITISYSTKLHRFTKPIQKVKVIAYKFIGCMVNNIKIY